MSVVTKESNPELYNALFSEDEIKEIDITKDLYLCSPLLNTECSKENCYINNGPCCHTVIKEHSQQHLLDYITNLQEEKDDYKNKFWEEQEQCEYLQDRIDKAIEYINSIIENIGLDLYNDDLDDLYILLNILQGKSDE